MTDLALHVLLAIGDGAAHGYAIGKDVQERSRGRLDPSTGGLYQVLKRLQHDHLIRPAAAPGGEPVDPRRRVLRADAGGPRRRRRRDRAAQRCRSARAAAPIVSGRRAMTRGRLDRLFARGVACLPDTHDAADHAALARDVRCAGEHRATCRRPGGVLPARVRRSAVAADHGAPVRRRGTRGPIISLARSGTRRAACGARRC